jgi:hypothetical protein
MAKREPHPNDPIMGGATAPLTPSPLPPIAGWAWILWSDPAQVCSMSQTPGHRTGWRRLTGPDAGRFFSPECGPQELPDERPKRKPQEAEDTPRMVSRTPSRRKSRH